MRDRIKNISGRIISRSFPLLAGKRLIYIVIYLRFFAFSAWIPPFFRIIAVSTRIRKMDDRVLTGILAHELCHQERYISMGLARYLKFIFIYTFSARKRYDEERATDMMTIDKGYAHELYELTLISSADKKHKPIIDNYLSASEIMEYAERTGKW